MLGWREAGGGDFDDVIYHVVRLLKNILVPKSQNVIAAHFKPCRAFGVILLRFWVGVSGAVQFDAELRGSALEIDDVATDWRLPAEHKAITAQRAKPKPQAHLGVRHVSSHGASALKRHRRS